MTRAGSILDRAIPPPGPDVTPHARIAWIREQTIGYAHDLALQDLLCGSEDGHAEAFAAAIGTGWRCQATPEEINTAANTTWQAATAEAVVTIEHIRRRVWPMAAARMPEAAIIQAADEAMARHPGFIPDELLHPLLRNIWNAANRRKRHA